MASAKEKALAEKIRKKALDIASDCKEDPSGYSFAIFDEAGKLLELARKLYVDGG
jgi:hypothetical protein